MPPSDADSHDASLSPDPTAARSVRKDRESKSSSLPRRGRRWALLVGIDQYDSDFFAPLKFCFNDVDELRRRLLAANYTVLCLHDNVVASSLRPTRDNIITQLQRLCSEAGPDDLIWVHFSCHGVIEDGIPLLISKDTIPAKVLTSAISLLDIEKLLRESRANMKVMTLDACHVGSKIGRGAGTPEFNRRVIQTAAGFALLAGSTSQQPAQEWAEKKHGVFTFYLMEALRVLAGRADSAFVTFDDVRGYVLNEVKKWSETHDKALQEPTARMDGRGDIPLIELRQGGGDGKSAASVPDEYVFLDYEITRWIVPPTALGTSCEVLDRNSHKYIIKILDQALPSEFRGRFVEEALKANDILKRDRGAARVVARGQTATGLPYIVTERIPGRTLADLLNERPLVQAEAVRISWQIARTLRAAHDLGTIHGDLRPENIILSPDEDALGKLQPKILEFGFAKLRAELVATRAEREWKSDYRAPEIRNHPPKFTQAVDVYGLGALLYHMLAGNPPSTPAQPLPPHVTKELAGLVQQMVTENFLDRPPLSHVLATLNEIGEFPRPSSPYVEPHELPPPRRRWLLVTASAALGLALLMIVWYWRVLPADSPLVPRATDLSTPLLVTVKPLEVSSSLKVKEALLQQAREVLKEALARHGVDPARLEALQQVRIAQDETFHESLEKLLNQSQEDPKVQALAAQALGQLGERSSVPVLLKFLTTPAVQTEPYNEALRALYRLSDPVDPAQEPDLRKAIEDVVRILLGPTTDPQKRRQTALLFAAVNTTALRILQEERRAQVAASSPVPLQGDLLLALAQARDPDAARDLASRLAFVGSPSVEQIRLAGYLAEEGDRTGLDLLKKSITDANGQESRLPSRVTLALSFVDPNLERCQWLRELLGDQTQKAEVRILAARSIGFCGDQRDLQILTKLLAWPDKPDKPDKASNQLLRVVAAGALIKIQRQDKELTERAELDRLYKLTNPDFTTAGTQLSSADLLVRLRLALKQVNDPHAPSRVRTIGATQVRRLENERQKREKNGDLVAAKPDPEVAKGLQILKDSQQAADPLQRLLSVIATADEAEQARALAKETNQEVREAIALQLDNPEANDVLRQVVPRGDIASLRAYGVLRKRKQPVPKPTDPFTLYRSGGAEERTQVIDALSGWPFAESKPTLISATRDGAMAVRRSTVVVIGENVADKQEETNALTVLRLMFGDPDHEVQQRIAWIMAHLDGPARSPASLPSAPAWPPNDPAAPAPPASLAGRLRVEGEEAGVQVTVGKQPWTLPKEQRLAVGKHVVSYLDGTGRFVNQDVWVANGRLAAVVIPVGFVDQVLGRAILLWNDKDLDSSYAKLREAEYRIRNHETKSTVTAHVHYYLGLVLTEKKQWYEANLSFTRFLNVSGGVESAEVEQVNKNLAEVRSHLASADVKVWVDGRCTTKTVWLNPGDYQKLKIDKHIFPDVTLLQGQTLHLTGDKECR